MPRLGEAEAERVARQPPQKWVQRVSLEELDGDITQAATLTPAYVLLVLSFAIVDVMVAAAPPPRRSSWGCC